MNGRHFSTPGGSLQSLRDCRWHGSRCSTSFFNSSEAAASFKERNVATACVQQQVLVRVVDKMMDTECCVARLHHTVRLLRREKHANRLHDAVQVLFTPQKERRNSRPRDPAINARPLSRQDDGRAEPLPMFHRGVLVLR